MPTTGGDGAGVVLASGDPRVNEEFIRSVPAGEDRKAVVLVGVVHDHPASVGRVRALAERVEPDVVALELPPLAVPLFERLGRAGRERSVSTPGDGSHPPDEMSAAVAASSDARVVGIDALGRRFVRRLLGSARREDASLATLGRAARAAASVAGHAAACRFAAHRSLPEARELAGGTSPEYDVGSTDPPAAQASDERTQVARSRSLLGAIERPHADRLVDDAREGTMAAALADLRREGSVLAVLGMDHLDAVTDRLGGSTAAGEGGRG